MKQDDRCLKMIEAHLVARGVRDPEVLRAMAMVPREAFVEGELAEFAYEDTPLPIAEGQTISQPYIVAHMIESARVRPGTRVLEIGTGSGYATAVLSRIAAAVFTVERHEGLAHSAKRRLAELEYDNVCVLRGDGTLGWKAHAPYDAIIVSAGAPAIPRPLLEQLGVGGRLVIPVGATTRVQQLLRVTRASSDEFEKEDLGSVQFVPLIGAEGWAEDGRAASRSSSSTGMARFVRETATPISDVESADLGLLLERIGDARADALDRRPCGPRRVAIMTREPGGPQKEFER